MHLDHGRIVISIIPGFVEMTKLQAVGKRAKMKIAPCPSRRILRVILVEVVRVDDGRLVDSK